MGTAAVADLLNRNIAAPASTKDAQSAASLNPTTVKNAPGVVTGGYLRNRAAAEKWFKFYNKASNPTVGTDVPIMQIGVPAGGSVPLGAVVGSSGLRFTTGIAYAVTGAYGTADTTNVAAADMDVELIYA
jgi:hypothetical protein